MNEPSLPSSEELHAAIASLDALSAELNQVLFGKEELIELTIVGVLARGHILLEGLPGLGKTELVKGLSHSLGIASRRVQFTPDLLPGDITGNPVLQEVNGRREFVFQQGPVFANILLADEINRASPKTQSALLEAMQERRVTVAGQTYPLPEPFFVLATANPFSVTVDNFDNPKAKQVRIVGSAACLIQAAKADGSFVTIGKKDSGVSLKIEKLPAGVKKVRLSYKGKQIGKGINEVMFN